MGIFGKNEAKQFWDPRDWGKSEQQIVAANELRKENDVLDAVQKGSSSSDEMTNERINDQQALKTTKGLGDATDKYGNGDTLFYPQELFTDSQPHGVHFYINARQTSVAATEATGAGADIERLRDVNEQYNKEYTAENRAKSEQYENASTAAAGLAGMIGTAAGVASGSITQAGKSFVGSAVTTVVGGGLAALGGSLIADNTNTIRLLKTIQLHVPASVIAAYTADWDETQTGIAGMIGSGKFDGKDLLELPEFMGRGLISAAANVPKGLGANADFGAVLEATSKKVSNPYKEQLFKSMGFRRFAFNYLFAPRNIGEAQQVMEIIDTFKYHMHPEASDGDMFLVYPSEFSIGFEILHEGKVKRNPYLPKISSCALTSVKATYGPDGMFNTFQGTDGIPSEINLELAFTELETLTAVRIAQGF